MGIGSMVAARAYLGLLGRREVLHRVGAREGDGKDLYLQDDVALHVGRGLVPQLAQLARHLLQRLVESGVRVGVRVRLRVRVRVMVRVRVRVRHRDAPPVVEMTFVHGAAARAHLEARARG